MHLPRAAFITFGASLVLLLVSARADETKPADPDLPQPLDLNVTQPLLESSPFTRVLDLSDTLKLTGIAYVKGKPVATLMDRATKKSYLVSEEPNAQGWRLAEANASSELKLTEVKLVVGTEVVSIRYSDAQIAPEKKAGGAYSHLTEKDIIRTDENGKPYVRGSVYLSDEDREHYYKGFSREAHDKYRDIIRNNRERMFSASHEERAAFSKKVFDAVKVEDEARKKK